MIDGRDLPPGYPVYTFVADDGENFWIDTQKIHDWANAEYDAGRLEPVFVPVEMRIAKKFFKENVVDLRRCLALADGRKLAPIIFASTPDDFHMLVDGHHRYTLYALMNRALILAFVLKPEQWEPFRIINMPKISKEILRAIPLRKRDY